MKKIKEQPWADNDNGCINNILTLIVCTFPLEPVVIYLENNQQLFQLIPWKKAFTFSLARAGKDIQFCYLWYCPIGCMDYISDFNLLKNNSVCIHLNTE